jgi:L-threonylcarbamoyladenylate synthase
MPDRHLASDSDNSDVSASTQVIADAVAALRAGELVVFPTETFYALGADPTQSKAMASLVRVKGRKPGNPIALIAADSGSAFAIADQIPSDARRLAERFWPGPLTLVLPAHIGLNEALVGPNGGVGVRVSPHAIARSLAFALGGLITATSANLSGEKPARSVIEARRSLGTLISAYVDGGVLSSDAPSTVVEFGADGHWRILRSGAIDNGAINAAVGRGG